MKISVTKGEQLEVVVDGVTTYQYPAAAPPAPAPVPAPTPATRGKGEYPTGPRWRGINRAGAEYGSDWDGWTGQTYFTWPTDAQVDAELAYLAGVGFNLVRLPIAWERLQRHLGGPLCTTYVADLLRVTRRMTARGFAVIVDLHNYNRYAIGTHADDQGPTQTSGYAQHVLGDAVLRREHLNDVWKKLALLLKDNPLVQLELMNESHDFPVTSDIYVDAINEQIAAIRTAGSMNLVHVPNSRGSDCDHFFANSPPPNGGSHDTVALLKVKDPANRVLFHVHQYLHDDNAGAKSATDLRDLVVPVTKWAESNHLSLFLGEFGANPKWPLAKENITALLSFISASPAWVGYSVWNLEPYHVTDESYVKDGPLMAPIKPFLTPHTV